MLFFCWALNSSFLLLCISLSLSMRKLLVSSVVVVIRVFLPATLTMASSNGIPIIILINPQRSRCHISKHTNCFSSTMKWAKIFTDYTYYFSYHSHCTRFSLLFFTALSFVIHFSNINYTQGKLQQKMYTTMPW